MEEAYNNMKVFIIGGATGIGRATVEKLIKLGALVCIMDINERGLNKLKTIYSDKQLLCIKGDTTQKNDITRSLTAINKTFRGLDAFIYCAGIYPKQLIIEMTESEWDKVIDVNLKGAFLSCQLISKYFIEQKTRGQIITVSSGSYRFAREGSGHYCASKAGLVMLTRVLAQELAKYNIFVNSIAPGLVDHPKIDKDYMQNFSERIPLGRVGDPEEIASVITLLLNPINTYLTGQVISVDGGVSAGHYGLYR